MPKKSGSVLSWRKTKNLAWLFRQPAKLVPVRYRTRDSLNKEQFRLFDLAGRAMAETTDAFGELETAYLKRYLAPARTFSLPELILTPVQNVRAFIPDTIKHSKKKRKGCD